MEFRINLQKYEQFSECSTEEVTEVYNYIKIKQYNNDTAYMRAAYIFWNFILKTSNSEAH